MVEPGYFRTDFLDPRSLWQAACGLEDYAATVGATRHAVDATNHAQPGDPVKAAAAIYSAVTASHPPLRLPLGADAVAAVEDKLARVTSELVEWRALSLATSYTNPAR
jgi:hypothetical protein